MCELKSNGGNRCEYSNALYNEKKKLKRTKKYKESSSYKKESLLLELEENFNINNSSLFKNHLKKREWWQTKARPLPQEKLVELEKKFSKPKTMDIWTALEHTKSLMEENSALKKENNENDVLNALNSYRVTSYILVNDYLRTRLKNEFKELPDYSDPELIEEEKNRLLEIAEKKANFIKKVIENHGESTEPRMLYKHITVPFGITPQEYAEKYFLPGERIRDKGFMSTTEDPSFIAGYVNMQSKKQFMVFQIISRKGITLQDSLEQPWSLQSLEKERLLPANVNYRIVGVSEEIFSVDQTRNNFMTQISRSARPIKNKKLTVVKLIDEDEI